MPQLPEPLGTEPMDEVQELRQQVQRLLNENDRLQSDLRHAQSGSQSGLHPLINDAIQNDKEVEVVRLEVVRSGGARSRSSSVLPGSGAAHEGPGRGAGSLLSCCQGPSKTCEELTFEKEGEEAVAAIEDGEETNYEEIPSGPLAKARRTADTLMVGATLHFSIKRLQRELQDTTLEEAAQQEKWDALHKQNAEMVFKFIMRHRGFFIKVGQKASTMAGALPEQWTQTLTPLQDHIPTTPYRVVRRIVRQDLGCSLDDVFGEFEPRPIASASIGQAHVARLRSGGEKVCVKIEHPGVAELAGIDLDNIEFLGKMLMKLHENAPDFSETLKDMRRASQEEVDFRLEAQNAQDALNALQHVGSPVGCPEPLPRFCGPRVLTMRFIEGWKITETERLPPGTNREQMAAQIVEAYAMLVFEEGLIHGDPHPGNIYVEKISEGPDVVRPVLLDWGIVKRVSKEERVALCKWVVASLSRDRFLYMQTLQELGFHFGEGMDYKTIDTFMFTSILLLRDTLPSSAMKQFHEQFKAHSDSERDKKQSANEGKKLQKVVEKIPGWLHFFFRGLGMVQDVCGMLDVTVPVARIFLKFALPKVLGAPATLHRPVAASALGGRPMERLVASKLEELGASCVLGAQVAVLADGVGGAPAQWACSLATGLTGLGGPPLAESTLVPLLDAGVGVLVACLLSALAKPTVTGKEIDLDTPVERLWPEFARAGKGGASVRELLQHQAGLGRPFRSSTTFETVCSEKAMEDAVADCPRCSGARDAKGDGAGGACRVLGVAAAAMLKRATGKKSAAEALRALLEPLGLQEDICYHSSGRDMARVGHGLLEEVSTSVLWELLEDRMAQAENDKGKKLPPWLSWEELLLEQPWCADPLLVNCPELLQGTGCAAGRGLRATAQALCRLYSSGAVPAHLLERSLARSRRLPVGSLEEWEDLGRCVQVGAGWQLLHFRRLDGGDVVTGHGHVDGSTGSIALRVPGASIAILLTSVDREARHVGYDILTTIASHFGLEPVWHSEVPKGVPDKLLAAGNEPQKKSATRDVEEAVKNMSLEMQRLRELIESRVGASRTGPADGAPGSDFVGTWTSADTTGLDDILDAVNVPAMARTLAKRLKRTLTFELQGERISLSSKTLVAGRQVEDSTICFKVGEAFEMQQMWGGTCQCEARWEDCPEGPALVINKQLVVAERDANLVERFELTEAGGLALSTTLVGKGKVSLTLQRESERDLLYKKINPKTFRLSQEVQLDSGEQVLRSGKLVSPSFSELGSLQLPGGVELFYGDLQSTTTFGRADGAPRRRRRSARAGAADSMRGGAAAAPGAVGSAAPAAAAWRRRGLCGLYALAHVLADGLRAMAVCLEGCGGSRRPRRARSSGAKGAAALPAADAGGNAAEAMLERQLSQAIGMTRQLSGGVSGDHPDAA